MDKYVMLVEPDKITIQEAEYIEDGWYIELVKNVITLYEIPLFGGKESIIGVYHTIQSAIDKGNSLT